MVFVHGRRLAARRRAPARREPLPWAARWSSTTRSSCDIATADERDAVSSRGLGARLPRRRPAARAQPRARHAGTTRSASTPRPAVRLSLLSAGAVVGRCSPSSPYRGRPRPAAAQRRAGARPRPGRRGASASCGHAAGPAGLPRDAAVPARLPVLQRRHPDGDRVGASIYGAEQLGFGQGDADRHDPAGPVRGVRRRPALRPRSRRATAPSAAILGSLRAVDASSSRSGSFLPAEHASPLVPRPRGAIGIVLGGSQALSRSLFSQLVPRGREAEYFSLYQACERGTSWFGTLSSASCTSSPLLPAGDRRAGRVLRRRRRPAGRVDVRARHPGGGQRGAGGGLSEPTRACEACADCPDGAD